ncbi:unnamed protein product [Aphanomyces euteiches]
MRWLSIFDLTRMFRVASRVCRQVLPQLASKASLTAPAFQAVQARFVPRFANPSFAAALSLPRFFSSEAQNSTVFVGGLPFETTEDQLRDVFEKYGEITNIQFMKQRNGRFNGKALVTYSEPSEAKDALVLDGEELGSRWMKVAMAVARERTARPDDCLAVRASNLPFNITEEQVRSMFEHCGEISHIFFPKDRDTGRLMGYAFVEFIDPSSVDKAIDVSGVEAFGRRVNVVYSTARKPQGAHKPEGTKSVFVGNLSEEVNSGMLQDLFARCGEIESVRLATDRETGEPRGFAYVNFADTEAVDDAIKLAGTTLEGQAIRVAFVRPRDQANRRQRDDHHGSNSRGFGRTNGERGYGGRGKRGGRDEGRFDRHHHDSDY